MSRELDRSRPHIMRKGSTGGYICMYFDAPGEYFDMKGNHIDSADAGTAGYNVEEDEKEATRQRLTAEALRDVDAKMAKINADVEEKVEAEHKKKEVPAKEVYQPDSPPASPVVVIGRNSNDQPRETTRRKMEGGSAGRWTVIDKATGDKLHDADSVGTKAAEAILMEKSV